MNAKRIFFDWSSVVAIAGVVATWATLSSSVNAHDREIERLRAAKDARALADVRIAETMATKTDVREVRDQVSALAAELRSARLNK